MHSNFCILSIVIIAFLLAACGGGHDAKPTTPAPVANQRAADPAVEPESEVDDSSDDVDMDEEVDDSDPAAAEPVDLEAMRRQVDATKASIPAPCAAYLETLVQYVSCDKVPEEARRSVWEAVHSAAAGWQTLNDPSIPPEALKAALDGCAQGTEALHHSAEALGCPLR